MKPFVHRMDKAVQLYSGDHKDSIPFFSARAMSGGNTVIFQIPGGGHLEVPLEVAVKFALGIIDISISDPPEIEEALPYGPATSYHRTV